MQEGGGGGPGEFEHVQRLPERERRQAVFDAETGLYAPWYFDLRIDEEMARSDRYGGLFIVVLIEPAGGSLPPEEGQAIVSYMKRGLRQTDLVTHLGGYRFAALLPSAGEAAGAVVARRIATSLGATQVRVGIACYPGGGSDFASLLDAAHARAQVAA